MPTLDPRIDAYIAKANPVLRPILVELRRRIHAGAPGIVETIKWGAPFFLVGDTVIASVAAFKAHAKLNWWGAAGFSEKPRSTDFTGPDELPAPAGFVAEVAAAAKALGSGSGVVTKAGAKKPVAKKPVAKKPVAKKPVAKKPAAKKPAGRA